VGKKPVDLRKRKDAQVTSRVGMNISITNKHVEKLRQGFKMTDIKEEDFIEDITKILIDMRGEPFDEMARSIWFYLQSYRINL